MTSRNAEKERLFHAATELADPVQRQAFLNAACGDDPSLRAEVESLLMHDASAGSLPDPPALQATANSPAGDSGWADVQEATRLELPGIIIAGRYKLLEQIGEGGMGTVWLADQIQPVRRKVALKLVKPGMDSRQVLARFEAERQALALMDHPHIAKVLDGGLTEFNRPYFVMEYVKGVSITLYCEANKSGIPERLQLFMQICQAVQHAHQKGIIHRDLKPSNILVAPYDDRAVPKVIDFGLAKALHEPLTEDTLHTAHAMVLGTPLYMSPEQAQLNNLDVDTRSDIYSLGVLLYELLTGTTPIEKQRLKTAAWQEVLRLIQEEEPARPSTRLGSTETLPSLAAGRQLEPVKLTRLVRGELDWIVMKALEKDRSRRYESANALALDIQRYLTGDLVHAAPPSAGYRLQKFARKHRAALAGAVSTALLIVALLGVTMATNHATRAAGLVKSLLMAETAQVPEILAEIEKYRFWADPLLRTEFDKPMATDRQKLNVSLALLPVSSAQADYLFGRLLAARPNEVAVIRDALARHKDGLLDKLWAAVESTDEGQEPQRLRAAAALARYDPQSEKWARASSTIVHDEVRENPIYLGLWIEMYRPVKVSLCGPLAAIFRDRNAQRASERALATDVLADYAADDPPLLADLLMDADESQFAVIYAKLSETAGASLPVLTGELDKQLPAERPSSDERRESLAKRQTNAAVALLRMNQPERVWRLLRHSSDPRVRSYLIDRLGPLGANAQAIINRLEVEPDLTARRALILSLGEYTETQITPDVRHALLQKLQAFYRTDGDPGLHLAAEWLLRTWQQEGWLKQTNEDWANDSEQRQQRLQCIDQQLQASRTASVSDSSPPVARQWYVNGQGQTMVVIPGPVEFLMGSPPEEHGHFTDERLHARWIGRSFALAAKFVTVEEYRRFEEDYSLYSKYTQNVGVPVVAINWQRGAKYCNWLSAQEGIPPEQWCYDIVGDEVRLLENYLSLSGYRFPTEAEIEYATRAEARTSRYYGETDDLLAKYAWCIKNSQDKTWPVGSLKPNDFGLFDALGNCLTWCQDAYESYPESNDNAAVDDREGSLVVTATDYRVARGGSHFNLASYVRSAKRYALEPSNRGVFLGIRPARTLPHVSVAPVQAKRHADLLPYAEKLALLAGSRLTQQKWHEAEHVLRELLEIREKSQPIASNTFETRVLLGRALLAQQEYAEAERLLLAGYRALQEREAMLTPSARRLFAEAYDHLVELYSATNKPGQAQKLQAERTPAELASAASIAANREISSGRTQAAIPHFIRWSQAMRGDTVLPMKIVALQVWFGQTQESVATRQRILAFAKGTNDAVSAERAAKAASILQSSDQAELEAALALARKAVEFNDGNPWNVLALGMAEYRDGRFGQANESLRTAANKGRYQPQVAGIAAFFLAMSLFRQGQVDEARSITAEAASKMRPLPADEENPLADNADQEDLILWLAYKEARALIQ